MPRTTELKCQCGARITRPIPPTCPNCGARFAGFRYSSANWLIPLFVAALLFAVLLAFLLWRLEG